jgi:hypothetical protein
MRKLIYGINVTLDGCCDHTKAISDEEVHYYFADLLVTRTRSSMAGRPIN